jgi:prophage antirepressor-like protein
MTYQSIKPHSELTQPLSYINQYPDSGEALSILRRKIDSLTIVFVSSMWRCWMSNKGELTMRIVMIDGQPWFVAKDVCECLNISNVSQVLENIPTDDVCTSREMLCVNEPGVYRLIFASRKPEAETFKDWVFRGVLSTIRRTGQLKTKPTANSRKTQELYRKQLALLNRCTEPGTREAAFNLLGRPQKHLPKAVRNMFDLINGRPVTFTKTKNYE